MKVRPEFYRNMPFSVASTPAPPCRMTKDPFPCSAKTNVWHQGSATCELPSSAHAPLGASLATAGQDVIFPTPPFVDAARELTAPSRDAQGDGQRLPYADGIFDRALTQHVTMNVADRPGFFREAHRDGGLPPDGDTYRFGFGNISATARRAQHPNSRIRRYDQARGRTRKSSSRMRPPRLSGRAGAKISANDAVYLTSLVISR